MNGKFDAIVHNRQNRFERYSRNRRRQATNDFINIFKYLAFIGCAGTAPVKQNILEANQRLVHRAGTIKNIKRWYLWTPQQLSIMSKVKELSRVLIFGGNGTGKTTMLESAAEEIAREGRGKNILYSIITSYPNLLLNIQAEVRFQKYKNVNVNMFGSVEDMYSKVFGAAHIDASNTYIFIDETGLPDNDQLEMFDCLFNLRAKSVWAALRVIKSNSKFNPKHDDPTDYLRSEFKDWDIFHLMIPMRNPKNIAKHVKKLPIGPELHGLGNGFNPHLNLDVNMPRGPEPFLIQDKNYEQDFQYLQEFHKSSVPEKERGYYEERLIHAFQKTVHNSIALIIINIVDIAIEGRLLTIMKLKFQATLFVHRIYTTLNFLLDNLMRVNQISIF